MHILDSRNCLDGSKWLVAVSVLALMSIVMLGYVLGRWNFLTVVKSVGIDVNRTSINVCDRKGYK